MRIKQVRAEHIDFINLTKQLDSQLQVIGSEETEDEREKYDSLNHFDNISWALIAYDKKLGNWLCSDKKT